MHYSKLMLRILKTCLLINKLNEPWMCMNWALCDFKWWRSSLADHSFTAVWPLHVRKWEMGHIISSGAMWIQQVKRGVWHYSVIWAVDGLNLSSNLASHAPAPGSASPCQISLALHHPKQIQHHHNREAVMRINCTSQPISAFNERFTAHLTYRIIN